MNPEKTGAFILKLRKKYGLTQQELAEKIGVTRKAISRWETGRGYPDIELLPKLAETLSVSISELLSGEELPKEIMPTFSEENLTFICNDAGQTNKRNKKTIIILIVLSAIALLAATILAAVALHDVFVGFFAEIEGSKNCIISADYSYITYYDEKYVPLDTKGYACRTGERLVKEAKVEGTPFFSKLLFGDFIYAVHGCPDSSIIYLQTDYDFPPSEYYVKESELLRMQEIIDNFERTYTYAVITQKDENQKEFLLNNDYSDVINNLKALPQDTSLDCIYTRGYDQESIPIITYEENHIFYKSDGEILYKYEKYYWYDYNNAENPTQYALEAHPYPLKEEYYDQLDLLFSYMWK